MALCAELIVQQVHVHDIVLHAFASQRLAPSATHTANTTSQHDGPQHGQEHKTSAPVRTRLCQRAQSYDAHYSDRRGQEGTARKLHRYHDRQTGEGAGYTERRKLRRR